MPCGPLGSPRVGGLGDFGVPNQDPNGQAPVLGQDKSRSHHIQGAQLGGEIVEAVPGRYALQWTSIDHVALFCVLSLDLGAYHARASLSDVSVKLKRDRHKPSNLPELPQDFGNGPGHIDEIQL